MASEFAEDIAVEEEMLGDGRETPSRYELLSMVKKNSNPLANSSVDGWDASDVETSSHFWHDILDFYFIRGKESRGRQDDDLIFFVRKNCNNDAESPSPYFVRRWAPELDDIVPETSGDVDWRRSFYLNLIAHSSFTLTVAICSHQDLHNYQEGDDNPLSPIYKVVKTVYASPSRVNFHLDSKKEAETTAAYPDICFSVDDFDSTFDAVVLTDIDHCYCVLLNATGGAAFPGEMYCHHSSSNNMSCSGDVLNSATRKNKLTIFSGFVSYSMVREAYDAGKSRLGSLLSFDHSASRTDRLYMKGPGGRGEVEVAVSSVIDQSQRDLHADSPRSRRGLGIGMMVRKAAVAAKHAYAAAVTSSEDDIIPLKCCLMSVSLPWELIAKDLLFKGRPPVNI